MKKKNIKLKKDYTAILHVRHIMCYIYINSLKRLLLILYTPLNMNNNHKSELI